MSQARPDQVSSQVRSDSQQRRGRSRESSEDTKNSSSSSEKASPASFVPRGRSRTRRPSNPFSEDSLRRRGYHSILSSFGNVFHVEKRWKMIRDLGSGAYGVVISAADQISGETVAIKMVTRVFEKPSLAKRALREITLLRHFSNHANITGLIDVDAISPDFNEIYLFLEPMEADLHQIIKSGQILTNEHVQYFVYQILRGMKYIHSASVVHRDLKPGNLLVNADCELKICDFGLSRGFDAAPDEYATHMTEYVATRWYRAPEIMLAFRRYGFAIDVWSIGCILAELLLGRPLFKGKDYVDQLNKILEILGTPSEDILQRISSDKAQAYVRSLPIRRTLPFKKLMPSADPLAVDLLTKMLAFDPKQRIEVQEALKHPWLSTYHDVNDEPECPTQFSKWKDIEKLETIEEYRQALWNEIEEYRVEVRSAHMFSGISRRMSSISTVESIPPHAPASSLERGASLPEPAEDALVNESIGSDTITATEAIPTPTQPVEDTMAGTLKSSIIRCGSLRPPSPASLDASTDPLVSYSRRSSILYHQRQTSAASSPAMHRHSYLPPQAEDATVVIVNEPEQEAQQGKIPFPSQGESYIVPARSRTASMAGDFIPRKLLRTLSTVSINESGEGVEGGLAAMGPVGKYIQEKKETGADGPVSEWPRDFGIAEENSDEHEGDGSSKDDATKEIKASPRSGTETKKKEKRFLLF